MADENQILTALGLDTAGFERGTSRAASATNVFMQSLNAVDSELRKIPILGDVYAITLGKVVDGFADTKKEAREFSRIMRTDVAGGLDETMEKLEATTELIGKLKIATLGRKLSDWVTDAKRAMLGQPGTVEADRQKNVNKLEDVRRELLRDIVDLHKKEERSRSEAYSKSTLITENARIELEYADRVKKAQEEATKFGGPDRDKWDKKVIRNLQDELDLATKIKNQELEAAKARSAQLALETSMVAAQAQIAAAGNSRDAARLQLDFAKQQQAIVKNGTKEQKDSAAAAVEAAQAGLKGATLDYEMAKRQLSIETEVMDLQTRGQTRAATQARIRAQFETQIADAVRRGNDALADSLRKQEHSAQLAEEIRQYKLGAGGRAKERQQERADAQIARIVESRRKGREVEEERHKREGQSQLGATHMAPPSHLTIPKGMQGSLLNHQKAQRDAAKSTEQKMSQFTLEVLGRLSSIDGSLKK